MIPYSLNTIPPSGFKLVTCRLVADAKAFILLHYAVKTEKSSALQLILQFIMKESTS